MVLVWGDLWVLRKRRGMVFIGENCKYHSRGEKYIVVISERPVGTTVDWRGVVFVWGRHVSTAKR